ncbi:2'-5' RNA ligase family protein [Lusitaniella coriacea LEGE 07157]|uniref:2'-5' RNA ligase family protein n=1 Tax=Lusitaniella coriacea LEGE 07157 TaxID=945747 RepID=A0A8J7DZY0_9CYAN|nr:2'-5' RNA ligase family protein [Lusitaniella coriacea]MBE9118493.1 2'-5' RNA ligase family protein [Lusitaniella coriacea LEGE 07157]
MSENRFFIALLPPQEVQEVANQIKQHFAEFYRSSKAFNSPPHITIHPPFIWDSQNLPNLENHLQAFAQNQSPIPIILEGFGAFKPRVIYINPLKTPELIKFQQDLSRDLKSTFGLIGNTEKNRPFAPHITVAFRDLTKSNFQLAWAVFKERELHFEFTIPQLTLLIHNQKVWEIYKEFSFK